MPAAISQTPKFSIVVPSYNQAEYLEECLESITGQTYRNWELLVIDGGSTDGSVEIIRKFEDRLAYWQSQKDAGQTNAINIGLGKATGEILSWLNSDDRYHPQALECVATAFTQDPTLDLLYGDQGIIDHHGQELRVIKCIPYWKHLLKFGGVGFPQPSTFFTRRALERLGFLREDLEYQMDTEFFLRFVKANLRIKQVYVQLADFRIHEASKTIRTDRLDFMQENYKLREDFLPAFLKSPKTLNLLKWATRLEGYLMRSSLRGMHRPFKGTTK